MNLRLTFNRLKFKHCDTKLKRRNFVYYIILCLFHFYIFLLIRKWYVGKVNISTIKFKYVTVHMDLKGSPPKLEYLQYLLPILKNYGVNAILMEYEDMFPYEGRIANLSAKSCYQKFELRDFLIYANQFDMEIIPLVQTFGHMEHALKLREFMHLREVSDYPDSICPSDPESIRLIKEMLKQVLNFHNNVAPVRHIHVGCDEVYSINVCEKCTKRQLYYTNLFMDHVKTVKKLVDLFSPHTKVLIWDDMMRRKKPTKYELAKNIEPVVWDYTPNQNVITSLHLFNLHNSFNKIWIATAFKGADGAHAVIPNITNRFLNHFNWLKNITNLIFAGETEVYNFEGIILTGWSRYSHMQPQCELLPVAMPSLILNLLLINAIKEGILTEDIQNMAYCDFYNKYFREEFENIFKCEDKGNKCSFENTVLYREHKKIDDLKSYFEAYSLEHFASLRCSVTNEHHPKHLKFYMKILKRALLKCSVIEMNWRSFMNKYYSNDTIQSYIDEKVTIYRNDIDRIIYNLENCSNVNFWKPRA